MHPHSQHIALPLEQLFAQLQAAGFRLDTARKLRLLAILEKKGAAHIGNFEELKFLLAPLVAGSESEQRRFYAVFEQFWADCVAEAEQWASGEQAVEIVETKIETPEKTFFQKWKWGVGLVFVLLTGFAVWHFLLKKPLVERFPCAAQLSLSSEFIREGDTLHFRNLSPCPDSNNHQWFVRDVKTGKTETPKTAARFDWVATGRGREMEVILNANGMRAAVNFVVHCSRPPQIPNWSAPHGQLLQNQEYSFEVTPKDKNARVQWIFNGKDTIDMPKAKYIFRENGPTTVLCKIYFNENDCYETGFRNYFVGTDKPILPLADLKYETPKTEAKLKTWVWLLFLLPLLPAAWFFRRWWRKRNQKPVIKTDAELAEEHPIHDRAPYFIPYQAQDGKISTPPDFFRMADVLRRREHSESQSFDIPASVRATVDSGGYPTLLEKRDTAPPEYLFLIERPDERNQQGRLFERLSTFLKTQDAPLTAFFHDGHFRSFWNDENPRGTTFDTLQKQHARCRLVLIGTGHGLYNPYDTRRPALRREPLEKLLFWKKSLFLSTLPVSGWYAPEILLHQYFPLFPADTEGIRAGLEALDALDEHEPGPFEKWEKSLAARRNDANPRFQLWETAEQHWRFLSPGATHNSNLITHNSNEDFRWLCGLAVAVQPDFALTIAIGKKMGIEVTHDRLLRLSRIPWLAENQPDTRLRLELLACLSPEDERLAREAAAEELEAVRAQVAGGFAEIEHKTSLAVHRFALEPDNESHRAVLRDLIRAGFFSGEQVAELDGLVRRRVRPEKISGEGNPAFGIDDLLAETPKAKIFSWELLASFFMLLCSFFLLDFAGRKSRELNQNSKESILVALKTEVDSALIYNDLGVAAGDLSTFQKLTNLGNIPDTMPDFALADSFFQKAIAFREKGRFDTLGEAKIDWGTAYVLARQNQIRARYNHCALRLRADFDTLNKPYYIAQDFEKTEDLCADGFPTEKLNARHGAGIAYFYGEQPGPARFIYQKLQEVGYFDTLTLRPNLETLLGITQNRIVAVEATTTPPSGGGGVIRANVTYQIGKKLSQKTHMTISAVDKTGKTVAFAQATLQNLSPGQFQGLFILLLTKPGQAAHGDSLVVRLFENDKRKAVLAEWKSAFAFDWKPAVETETGPPPNVDPNSPPPPPPVADRDNDGVPDDWDDCPDKAGTFRMLYGCPEGNQAPHKNLPSVYLKTSDFQTAQNHASVEFGILSSSNSKDGFLKNLLVRINDRHINVGTDIVKLIKQQGSDGRYLSEIQINVSNLQTGKNTIRIGVSQPPKDTFYFPEKLEITYQPLKPNMHILSIGVNGKELKYAVKDANDFASTLAKQSNKGLYGSILTTVNDDKTGLTKQSILSEINKLRNAYQDGRIKQNDVVSIFYSGHGYLSPDGEEFFFKLLDSTNEENSIISFGEIVKRLSTISCKKIFFIDACFGGQGEKSFDVLQLKRENCELFGGKDYALFVAAQPNQVSYEDDAFQNGLFTESILEALDGKSVRLESGGSYSPDANGDKLLSIGEFSDFLKVRVPDLSRKVGKKEQNPYIRLNDAFSNEQVIFSID